MLFDVSNDYKFKYGARREREGGGGGGGGVQTEGYRRTFDFTSSFAIVIVIGVNVGNI